MSKKLDGLIVSRNEIYELLRKNAITQQSISQLLIEKESIKVQLEEVKNEYHMETVKRRILWIKEKKYDYLLKRLKREVLLHEEFLEEVEQEEVIYGKNKSN